MSEFADLNRLTGEIIGAAIEVHRHLGPGLLESAYETCLAYELENNLSILPFSSTAVQGAGQRAESRLDTDPAFA